MTIGPTDLIKLAERVEREQPSGELNRAVAKSQGWHRVEPHNAYKR